MPFYCKWCEKDRPPTEPYLCKCGGEFYYRTTPKIDLEWPTDAIVRDVEAELGMASGAWGTIDPKAVIAAAWWVSGQISVWPPNTNPNRS